MWKETKKRNINLRFYIVESIKKKKCKSKREKKKKEKKKKRQISVTLW